MARFRLGVKRIQGTNVERKPAPRGIPHVESAWKPQRFTKSGKGPSEGKLSNHARALQNKAIRMVRKVPYGELRVG